MLSASAARSWRRVSDEGVGAEGLFIGVEDHAAQATRVAHAEVPAVDEVEGEAIPRRLVPVAAVRQVVEGRRVIDQQPAGHAEAQAQHGAIAAIGVHQQELPPTAGRSQRPSDQGGSRRRAVEASLEVPVVLGVHPGHGPTDRLLSVASVQLDLEDLGHCGMMAGRTRQPPLTRSVTPTWPPDACACSTPPSGPPPGASSSATRSAGRSSPSISAAGPGPRPPCSTRRSGRPGRSASTRRWPSSTRPVPPARPDLRAGRPRRRRPPPGGPRLRPLPAVAPPGSGRPGRRVATGAPPGRTPPRRGEHRPPHLPPRLPPVRGRRRRGHGRRGRRPVRRRTPGGRRRPGHSHDGGPTGGSGGPPVRHEPR